MQGAVVNEALRLNHGAIGRLPRVSNDPVRYGEWVIPAGVSAVDIVNEVWVGMLTGTDASELDQPVGPHG